MKNKKLNADTMGQQVKIISEEDVPRLLKTISKDTWLIHFPKLFIDLINGNKQRAIETIHYAPNIYFDLNMNMRKDKQIIRATIKSFKSYNKLKEINDKSIPLTRR